jgi:ABC-type antimicrobial peptide transport system permease subunit
MKSLLNRVALSLWYNKRRNILIILWFFLLLFLLNSVTIISIASRQQISDLNRAVGNCVIVQKVKEDSDEKDSFYSKEIEALTEHPYVKSYNAVNVNPGMLVDAAPFARDKERYAKLLQLAKEDGFEYDECMLFSLTNSENYTLFTSAGFSLVKGKHITADNARDNVALISSSLAKENNLSIGDSITIAASNLILSRAKTDSLTLTIVGLFDYPEISGLYKTKKVIFEYEYPANYIFVPGEVLSSYCYYYAPTQIIVYLQETGQIEDYINDMKEELGDSYTNPVSGVFHYNYIWDEEWFSTVSKPAVEVSNIATATAVGLGIGIFIIILLIYALLLNGKKYEMGIYLALGESKTRLVVQTVLEELALLLVALFLACLLSVVTASGVSRIVMDKPASETNAAIEQQRDEIVRYESYGQYNIENEINSARTTYFYVNDRLNVNDSMGIFVIYVSIGIIVIVAALAGQVIFFLRKSPAKLLLTK